MVIDVEIDVVEYTLPVELHGKIPEPDEFLGHYPPPFLYRFRQNLTWYNYSANSSNVNVFWWTNVFFIRIVVILKGAEETSAPF